MTVYMVRCPRCGATDGEPCWHMQRKEPLMWPHRERKVASDSCDFEHPHPGQPHGRDLSGSQAAGLVR